ncbi:hypothetical protein COCOBI_02-1420 [Coccomyxa sp. Obi]|nr:hypothetical protein COCOBI_02-1420 [Coccomyxa sp. Obi]
MLRRKVTRIELKAEDKEEYEAIKKAKAEALAAGQAAAGKQPLDPLGQAERKGTTASRIGFSH